MIRWENANRYELFIGLNDKESKVQEISTDEAYNYIMSNVISTFGGGTITVNNHGVYKHDDGTLVDENTIKIDLSFVDDKKMEMLEDFMRDVMKAFNQESILIVHNGMACYYRG